MKKKIIVLFALVLANSLYASWPMESITNYNVLMVHGAYGAEKVFFSV